MSGAGGPLPNASALAAEAERLLGRYEECKRWRAEKNGAAQKALHEFGVAAVQEEQARVAYLAACAAMHAVPEVR